MAVAEWELDKFSILRTQVSILGEVADDNAVPTSYKIRARLGTELIKMMRILLNQMLEIYLPILIMNGTADRLSDPKGSEILYDRLSSRDKTLKLYDGFCTRFSMNQDMSRYLLI